jgi:hypothetical protein
MPQHPFEPSMFMQDAANYRGMFTHVAEPRMSADIPFGEFFGGDMNGLAAQLVIQPLMDQAFGAVGMVPAQFQPLQNLHDQFEAKRYWESRQTALATAASADKGTYVEMMRGVAKMADVEFGLEEEAAANAIADDITGFTPILAQLAPDFLDRLHGTRGSAVSMAHYMHEGGRQATDSVTGRVGMTGETAGAMAASMHELYFGPGADLSQFKGLSAGQAGQLFGDMTERGIGPRSIGTFEGDDRLEQLMGSEHAIASVLSSIAEADPQRFDEFVTRAEAASGRNVSDMGMDEKLQAMSETESVAADALRDIEAFNPNEFEQVLRQFDARKVADRIKNLSGSVNAMRDIFGDMGRPNAPMSELLNGLQSLTQGGMATLSPQELEHTVRMTSAIAKQTGLGIDGMMGLTGEGAAHADRLGLERVFAPASAQGAATFGAAFGEVGGGDQSVWGARNRQHLTLQDQKLRMSAATSEMANQMAAAMRLNATTELAGGTAAAAFVDAVELRETTFVDPTTGETRSVDMNRDTYLTMMEGAGIGRGASAAFLDQTGANEQFVFENDLQDFIRNDFQGDEIARTVVAEAFQQSTVSQISTRGDALGLSRQEAIQLSRIVGEEAGVSLVNADAAIQRNPEARRQHVASQMRSTLIERMTNTKQADITALEAAGLTPEAARDQVTADMTTLVDDQFTNDQLLRMSESGWGKYEHIIDTDPAMSMYETAQASLSLHNKETLQRQRAQEQQAEATVKRQQALSSMGRAGPLRRIMDEIQDPHGDIAAAIAHITGGVDEDALAARLEPLERELEEAQADPASFGDIEALKTGGHVAQSRLDALAESKSMSVQELLTSDDDAIQSRAAALHEAAASGGIRGLRAAKTYLAQATAVQQLHADFDAADKIADPVVRSKTQSRIATQMQAVAEGGDMAGTALRRMQLHLGLDDEQWAAVLDGRPVADDAELQARFAQVVEASGVTTKQLQALREMSQTSAGRTPGERKRRAQILEYADDAAEKDTLVETAGLSAADVELIASMQIDGPDALTAELNTITDRRDHMRQESAVFGALSERQVAAIQRGEKVDGVSLEDQAMVREDLELQTREAAVRDEIVAGMSVADVTRQHRQVADELLSLDTSTEQGAEREQELQREQARLVTRLELQSSPATVAPYDEPVPDAVAIEAHAAAVASQAALRSEHDVFTRLSSEQLALVEADVIATDVIRDRGVSDADVIKIREGDDSARPDLTPAELQTIRDGSHVPDVTDADKQIVRRDLQRRAEVAATKATLDASVAIPDTGDAAVLADLQAQRAELRDAAVFQNSAPDELAAATASVATEMQRGAAAAEIAATTGMDLADVEALMTDIELSEQQDAIVENAATRAAMSPEIRAEYQKNVEAQAQLRRETPELAGMSDERRQATLQAIAAADESDTGGIIDIATLSEPERTALREAGIIETESVAVASLTDAQREAVTAAGIVATPVAAATVDAIHEEQRLQQYSEELRQTVPDAAASEDVHTAARTQLRDLVAEKGLTPEQLDTIRTGARAETLMDRMELTDEQVAQIKDGERIEGVDVDAQRELRALMRQHASREITPEMQKRIDGLQASQQYGSATESVEALGVITDAELTAEHTLETVRAADKLQEQLAALAVGGITLESTDGQEAFRDVSRAVEMRDSVLNVALTDTATFRQLGRITEDRDAAGVGGMQAHELLTSTRDLRDQQQDQAAELGYSSVAEMLTHEADNADVTDLELQMQERTTEIDRRMRSEFQEREQVTAAERADYEERKATDMRSVTASLESLQSLGILDAETSEAELKELATVISDEGFDASRQFSHMAEARAELEEMAIAETKERGERVTTMDLMREAEGLDGLDNLTAEERERVTELQIQAGRLAEVGDVQTDEAYQGRTDEVLQGVMEEIAKEVAAAVVSESQGEAGDGITRIVGTVQILDDEQAVVDFVPVRAADTPLMPA